LSPDKETLDLSPDDHHLPAQSLEAFRGEHLRRPAARERQHIFAGVVEYDWHGDVIDLRSPFANFDAVAPGRH
jgi:hypothetical protein